MSPERDPDERSQFDEPVRRTSARPGNAGRAAKILIVQTGSAGPLVAAHGDYPDWFRAALGAGEEEMPLLRAHAGEKLSPESLAAHGAQGILVTGSPLSVTAHEAWMADLGGELLRAGERGVPVLGICFGHQLLCESAGAQVIQNPRGREIGSVELQLTEAGARDPLFAWTRREELAGGSQGNRSAGGSSLGNSGAGGSSQGFADDAPGGRIFVQATHVDAVRAIPAGATLLATNENTPVQAVRFSEAVASVQFHPELRPEALRDLIRSREALLAKEDLHAETLAAAVRETRGAEILRAFAAQVRRA